MMVTIDKAGRIVVPKEVREQLSIDSGAELRLEVEGDSIRIAPVPKARRRFEVVDGLAVFPAGDGQPLTDLDVQRLRDGDQR